MSVLVYTISTNLTDTLHSYDGFPALILFKINAFDRRQTHNRGCNKRYCFSCRHVADKIKLECVTAQFPNTLLTMNSQRTEMVNSVSIPEITTIFLLLFFLFFVPCRGRLVHLDSLDCLDNRYVTSRLIHPGVTYRHCGNSCGLKSQRHNRIALASCCAPEQSVGRKKLVYNT